MNLHKILLLAIGFFLPLVAHGGETLRFAGGGEQDDPFDRISKEVLTEAYRRIGIKVSFKTLPPARALKLSNAGRLDGEMHRISDVEKKYSNLVKIPVPINQIEVLAFTIRNDIQIEDVTDLMPYRVGIRNGVKFAEYLTDDFEVYKVDDTDQLFRMLGLWRIDVALSTRSAGLKVIENLDLRKINIPTEPLFTKSLYHYLNSKHQHIVPKITKSLRDMESEGWIQQKNDHVMDGKKGIRGPLL